MPETETVALADLIPDVPQNRELLACWRRLQDAAGGIPRRAQFDPSTVPQLLPNIMLVDRRDGGELRVRLMGTILVDRYGQDMTGKELLAALPEEMRATAGITYNEVLDLPCIYIVKRRIKRASGLDPVIEVLHLPWLDTEGAVRYVMSSLWGVEGRLRPEREDEVKNWQVAAARQRALL